MSKPTKIDMNVDDACNFAIEQMNAGNLEQARLTFEQVIETVPNHAHSIHYLGVLEYQQGNISGAVNLIERSIELDPGRPEYYQNLGGIYRTQGNFTDAVPVLIKSVEMNPDDPVTLGNLCHAYYQSGEIEKAVSFGQKTLDLKDKIHSEKFNGMKLNHKALRPNDGEGNKKNVISFSLFGQDPYYRNGAILNAKLARHIYPEWTCRFYVDASIPKGVIETLAGRGSEVIQFSDVSKNNIGLFWRFYVANDPEVDRFLCRDCDSVLNVKERVAVEEWIDSGEHFHIMRDNVIHTELILGGMWGGMAGLLPDAEKAAHDYVQRYAGRWADQHYLRSEIWPLIKDHSLTHDSFYTLGNSKPFPEFGSLPPPGHVGGSLPRDIDHRPEFDIQKY